MLDDDAHFISLNIKAEMEFALVQHTKKLPLQQIASLWQSYPVQVHNLIHQNAALLVHCHNSSQTKKNN